MIVFLIFCCFTVCYTFLRIIAAQCTQSIEEAAGLTSNLSVLLPLTALPPSFTEFIRFFAQRPRQYPVMSSAATRAHTMKPTPSGHSVSIRLQQERAAKASNHICAISSNPRSSTCRSSMSPSQGLCTICHRVAKASTPTGHRCIRQNCRIAGHSLS